MKANELILLETSTITNARLNAGFIEDSYTSLKNTVETLSMDSFPETISELEEWNILFEIYINTNPSLRFLALYDNEFEIIQVYPESSFSHVSGIIPAEKTEDTGILDLFYPIYEGVELKGFIYAGIGLDMLIESIPYSDENYIFSVYQNEILLYESSPPPKKELPSGTAPLDLNSIYNLKLSATPTFSTYRTALSKSNQFLAYGLLFAALLFLLLLFLQNKIRETKIISEQNKLFLKQLENEQRLESIGVLSSSVAHEINNPINGIMNYIDLIKEVLPNDIDEYSYADEITAETNRIASLVRNILQFSRKSTDTFSIARVQDILNRTANLVNTILYKDNIRLIINCPDNIPEIKCHSNKIQQVLLNLILNSRDTLNEKYGTDHPDKKIITGVEEYTHKNSKGLLFTIEDFGMGMSDDIKDQVFQSFFTTKSQDSGTGLGLFITKHIIDEHKGDIWFETYEERGTKFFFFIPLQ